ncbi:MAG: DegV family protein, partial [Rectinema sp.]|nr:DegV family protein [Rectinema sp.]
HVQEILYIGMTSALSGTFQAGVRAVSHARVPVFCFDSRTITAGEGVLVTHAVELAENGAKAADIVRELETLRQRLRFFIAIPDLRSLIRSGRLHGIKSLVLRKFGLRPLLTTDLNGRAKVNGLYASSSDTVSVLFSKLKKILPAGSRAEVHITHVASAAVASRLAELCRTHLDADSRILTVEMGPVLASLGWLGALGLAVVPLSARQPNSSIAPAF